MAALPMVTRTAVIIPAVVRVNPFMKLITAVLKGLAGHLAP